MKSRFRISGKMGVVANSKCSNKFLRREAIEISNGKPGLFIWNLTQVRKSVPQNRQPILQ